MEYINVGVKIPIALQDAAEDIFDALPNKKTKTGYVRHYDTDGAEYISIGYDFEPPLTKEQTRDITDKFLEMDAVGIHLKAAKKHPAESKAPEEPDWIAENLEKRMREKRKDA